MRVCAESCPLLGAGRGDAGCLGDACRAAPDSLQPAERHGVGQWVEGMG